MKIYVGFDDTDNITADREPGSWLDGLKRNCLRAVESKGGQTTTPCR